MCKTILLMMFLGLSCKPLSSKLGEKSEIQTGEVQLLKLPVGTSPLATALLAAEKNIATCEPSERPAVYNLVIHQLADQGLAHYLAPIEEASFGLQKKTTTNSFRVIATDTWMQRYAQALGAALPEEALYFDPEIKAWVPVAVATDGSKLRRIGTTSPEMGVILRQLKERSPNGSRWKIINPPPLEYVGIEAFSKHLREKIGRYTRGQYFAIPLAIDGHITSVVVDTARYTIDFYDPSDEPLEAFKKGPNAKRVFQILESAFPNFKLKQIRTSAKPHQGVDDPGNCGLFVCNYMKRRMDGLSSRTARTTPAGDFRNLLQAELRRSGLKRQAGQIGEGARPFLFGDMASISDSDRAQLFLLAESGKEFRAQSIIDTATRLVTQNITMAQGIAEELRR